MTDYMKLGKTIKNLCTPAYIYIFISAFAILFALFSGFGIVAVLTKAVFVIFWTYVLNMLCIKGYKNVSWFLVLLPYCLILLGYLKEGFDTAPAQRKTPIKAKLIELINEQNDAYKVFKPKSEQYTASSKRFMDNTYTDDILKKKDMALIGVPNGKKTSVAQDEQNKYDELTNKRGSSINNLLNKINKKATKNGFTYNVETDNNGIKILTKHDNLGNRIE